MVAWDTSTRLEIPAADSPESLIAFRVGAWLDSSFLNMAYGEADLNIKTTLTAVRPTPEEVEQYGRLPGARAKGRKAVASHG